MYVKLKRRKRISKSSTVLDRQELIFRDEFTFFFGFYKITFTVGTTSVEKLRRQKQGKTWSVENELRLKEI